MHAASSVLQKCLPEVFAAMHAVRARALLGAVQALLSGRRLILMDLARAWPGAERVRGPLKCLDRLLSNPHLHAQREACYAGMLRWLLRDRRPIVLVDWSQLHADGRWQLLRAAIPVGGRTLTILDLVYPESMQGSAVAERELLKRLRVLLPRELTPILVTDAHFRAPWFRAVARLGWHSIGRMRHRTHIQFSGGEWFDHRQLFRQASARGQRFDSVRMVGTDPWYTDLVLYRRPHRGRVCRTRRHPRRSRGHDKAERREREPWLLTVSCGLRDLSVRQILRIYAQRMQIEQSFRDLKCERFGCAFTHSLTRQPQRIAMLLLIHALATFIAWLAGLAQPLHTAAVRYGGIVGPRLHYSRLRLGWERLRRSPANCSPEHLLTAFRHPPPEFLLQLRIPL